jgi:hypothetical protein
MNYRKLLSSRLAAVSFALLLLTTFATAQAPQTPASIGLPTVNIDEAGRIPYWSAVAAKCNGTVCTGTFAPIPAGHRLVIQHVAGDMTTQDPTTDATRVLISFSNKFQFNSFPTAPFVSGVFVGVFDQPTLFYVDAGQTPIVQVHTGGLQMDTFGPVLIGYELDCTKNACAPLAGVN